MTIDVSVRGVDSKVFREFKSKTVLQGTKTGVALTQAMREWVEKKETKTRKRNNLFSLKAWDWGKDNTKASVEVDETLYGEKR